MSYTPLDLKHAGEGSLYNTGWPAVSFNSNMAVMEHNNVFQLGETNVLSLTEWLLSVSAQAST